MAALTLSGALLIVVALGLAGCTSETGTVPSLTPGQSAASSTSVTETMPQSTTTTVERVETYMADWNYDRANLQYLVDASDVIVRGRVIQEPVAQWNSPDGKQWTPKDASEGAQFYTTWTIQAEEVFKGDVSVGTEIPFRFEGGTVEFNGRVAHYVGNDYPEMSKGDEVIICGRRKTRIWGAEDLPGFWIPAGFFVFARGEDGAFQRMVPGGGPKGTDAISPNELRSMVADMRAGQIRDYFGLWVESVETLPAQPTALPPHFLTPPGEIDAFRAETDDGTSVVLPALGVKTPLWVFAGETNIEEVGSRLRSAMADERPVVVFGADEQEVYPYLPGSEEVVFFTPDVPRENKLIAWVPYQGFRTSVLMDSTEAQQEVRDLTDAEDLYWQLGALTLWRDWRGAWRRAPDTPDARLWPQNRGPYPETFSSTSIVGDQISRWVWQNGCNIVSDGSGRPTVIPIPNQIPAGIVVPAKVIEGSPYGTPRGGPAPQPGDMEITSLAPGEWDRYVELYQTGVAFYLVQGYDGYMHPAALEDVRTETSPDSLGR